MTIKSLFNKLTLGLYHHDYYNLTNRGCLRSLEDTKELSIILKNERLEKKDRVKIFIDLFGEESDCHFSKESHTPDKFFNGICFIVFMIVSGGEELKVTYNECAEIASFYSSRPEGPIELQKWLSATFSARRFTFDTFEAHYFTRMLVNEKVSKELLEATIPTLVKGYESVRVMVEKFPPVPNAVFLTSDQIKMNGVEELLRLITKYNYMITGKSLMPIAYSPNAKIRDIALKHTECPKEAKIAARLMGSRV